MKARFYGLGSLFVIMIAVFTIAGCSDNNPVEPMVPDNTLDEFIAFSPANDEPRDNQSAEFSLSGEVVDIDESRPLVVLAAKTQSDRSETISKYNMEVSRDATVIFLRDRSEVSFDAGYLQIGTSAFVTGVVLNDGTMIAEKFELWQEDPNSSISSSNR